MGERKVLNKYYPPDFDPAKLPRGHRGNKDQQMKVRMMLSMSVRCSTCGNYMYKGTKFTMRMEDVVGEDYLGIRIFRFYFHCKNCAAEITMKTDPQNSDYALEHGATRNYEPWRDKDKTVMEAVADREAEEKGNAMKALENRTLDSKQEMDIMDALEELQALNGRHGKVDTEAAIQALHRSAQTDEAAMDEADEAAVREIFKARAQKVARLDESAAAAAVRKAAEAAAARPGLVDGGASAAPERPNGDAAPAADVVAKLAAKPRFAVKPRIAVQPKRPAPGGGNEPPAKKMVTNDGPAGGGNGGGSAAATAPDGGGSAAAAAPDGGSPHSSGGGLAVLLGSYGSGSDSNS